MLQYPKQSSIYVFSHSDHEAVAVAIGLRRTEQSDAGNASSEDNRPLLKETVELLSAASGSMYWRQVMVVKSLRELDPVAMHAESPNLGSDSFFVLVTN